MRRFLAAALFIGSFLATGLHAAAPTPIRADQIDPAAYTQWVGGQEQPAAAPQSKDNSSKPTWVLWTDTTTPGHAGQPFGQSREPGPRHLRIGFKSPATIGAALVRGNCTVSVLRESAAYPGNVADDSQWVPAERIKDGKVSREEGRKDQYVLWTFPAALSTRAIRFTHDAQPTEKDYSGTLEGAFLLPQCVANIGPQALSIVSSNDRYRAKLIDENYNATWEQWANLPLKGGDRPEVVSEKSPEWAMLKWDAPVTLSGVGLCFAGFGEGEIQSFTGKPDTHPREATDADWTTVAKVAGLKNRYPIALGVDWVSFDKDVKTTAIRLKITRPLEGSSHPHTQGHARDGKRVWVGELIALSPVGAGGLKSTILPKHQAAEHPPIPVKFTLPEAGWVTLVIEDSTGKRVRNLISETWFDKGENTAWWDGSDDLGRDPSAAKHGLYYIPTQFVAPGNYRVRGLWRKQVDLKYEFGVYSAGSTPWETADKAGGWLSNHTPPSAVLFVPDVVQPDGKTKPSILIGSYVSEGTAGLAWCDLDGKKYRGQGWVGGNWTGAPHITRDVGSKPIAEHYAYVASAWSAGDGKKKPVKGEIRLTALTAKEDQSIVKYEFTPDVTALNHEGNVRWEDQIGGVAARDGKVVITLPASNKILWIDVAAKAVTQEGTIVSPRGVALDTHGRLLVLSKNSLIRYGDVAGNAGAPGVNVIVRDLDDPAGLALDPAGNIYVAERGNSHQVKVFTDDGKPLRTIGHAGAPSAGPYDPLHMNNPRGLTIDSAGRLWVAEEDSQPKRVSVWNADGTLHKAFYGPMEYGGGGVVDPVDKTKFYYAGMEFKLDWEKGTDQVASVFYRPGENGLKLPFRAAVPQAAIYSNGKRYWTNSHNSNPTGGHGSAFLFADRNGIAVPAVGFGRANDWDLLNSPEFAKVWPEGTDSKANPHTDKAAIFLWQDANADGQVQPEEIKLRKGTCGSVMFSNDLSIFVSRIDGKAVRFAPTGFSAQGVPTYDFAAPSTLVDGANTPLSSGGDQVLAGPNGWTIHTNAPKPFSAAGIGGARNGEPLWSYPSLWPGLHASHEAPVPDRAGEIIGHTRLLGDLVTPKGSDPMFFLNGNCGSIYVFTYDGLFVAQLFQDMRLGRPWQMPSAPRGMVLNELTPSDENFWPNVAQTADGSIYLTAGRPCALVKVDGLETVERLRPTGLTVTVDDLKAAQDAFATAEAARQAAQGRGVLKVALRDAPPTVDGKLDDWKSADWADIDKRGTRAYFNSNAEPYDVTAAVAIAGDRLYAAWRTGDKDLLKNAGDVPNAPFKTGGALDLMLATSSAADSKRQSPAAGDIRLLITLVNGKPRALVYRPVVANGPKTPVDFSSPWRTITFDRVDDVSDQVTLAAGGEGNYEISIPLTSIGVKPEAGKSISADIGILRGTGATTTQRVYWTNKATNIVADVPSEAELRPALWGRFEFVKDGK